MVVPRTSGILFDDLDLTLLKECQRLGATSTHNPESIALVRDKDRQYIHLSGLGLECLPTLIHRGPLNQNDLRGFYDSKQWVIKSSRGNKGIGHQLLSTDEVIDWWPKAINSFDQRYIIQPYLENLREFRVLTIGHKSYTLEKINGKSWKKNASSSEFVEAKLTPQQELELKRINASVIKATGLSSFAIDLFLKDSFQIIEVNAHPGMSAASSALKTTELYHQFLSYYLKLQP